MAAALLEEFGGPDARESWRYSRVALRALEQHAFADAARDLAPSPELAARFDPGRVIVNGASDESITLGDGENLHLVYLSLGAQTPSRWRHRLKLAVPRGRASVIRHFLGEGAEMLGAATLEVELCAGAHLESTTIADLPDNASLYARESARLAESATLATNHLVLGARFARFDVDVALAASGAKLDARGAFALRGRSHADIHLDVTHAARDTACDVRWRGVADQRARGILHGAITVAPGADGADAKLQTKNLLLSPHAEIDAQPILVIHADEVKAAHGATVGQLDERSMFYLRSRGIPAATARAMLIAGFVREAFVGIDPALRARLEALLPSTGEPTA